LFRDFFIHDCVVEQLLERLEEGSVQNLVKLLQANQVKMLQEYEKQTRHAEGLNRQLVEKLREKSNDPTELKLLKALQIDSEIGPKTKGIMTFFLETKDSETVFALK